MRGSLLVCLSLMWLIGGIYADSPAFDDPDSPWYLARKGQLVELRDWLNDHPQSLNSKDSVSRSPLFYAAKSGRTAVVELLLKQTGIETDHCDDYGSTPWHWAAMYGHVDVLRLMKKHKVDVNVKDEDGNSPLHVSFGNAYSNVHQRHEQVVRTLLDMGADPNARNDAGQTPLLSGVSLVTRVEALEVLLSDKRVDVKVQDREGNTALHRAIGWRSVPLIRTLLKRGADPTARNKRNETPIDRARQLKRSENPQTARVAAEIEKLLQLAKRE